MVISSPKHKIPTNVYSPFTFVLGKDIIILSRAQYDCSFKSSLCFTFWNTSCLAMEVLQLSRLDDLQNTGFDQLKIVKFFGPQQEARQKETFNTITNFTLSHMYVITPKFITNISFSQSLQRNSSDKQKGCVP